MTWVFGLELNGCSNIVIAFILSAGGIGLQDNQQELVGVVK